MLQQLSIINTAKIVQILEIIAAIVNVSSIRVIFPPLKYKYFLLFLQLPAEFMPVFVMGVWPRKLVTINLNVKNYSGEKHGLNDVY